MRWTSNKQPRTFCFVQSERLEPANCQSTQWLSFWAPTRPPSGSPAAAGWAARTARHTRPAAHEFNPHPPTAHTRQHSSMIASSWSSTTSIGLQPSAKSPLPLFKQSCSQAPAAANQDIRVAPLLPHHHQQQPQAPPPCDCPCCCRRCCGAPGCSAGFLGPCCCCWHCHRNHRPSAARCRGCCCCCT